MRTICKKVCIKNILLLIAAIFSEISADGQTIREVWKDMPNSVVPYLSRNIRTELADYIDMKVKAETVNLLKKTTYIDTLTTNYMRVCLSEASLLEMRLLKRTAGDTVICVVETFRAPLGESRVTFYHMNWMPIHEPLTRLVIWQDLVAKPKIMGQEHFDKLCKLLQPYMMEAHLSIDAEELVWQLSVPLITRDEQEEISLILLQITLKWTGENFN